MITPTPLARRPQGRELFPAGLLFSRPSAAPTACTASTEASDRRRQGRRTAAAHPPTAVPCSWCWRGGCNLRGGFGPRAVQLRPKQRAGGRPAFAPVAETAAEQAIDGQPSTGRRAADTDMDDSPQ